MTYKITLTAFVLIFILQCSVLFWSQNSLIVNTYWLNSKLNAVVILLFEEKTPWQVVSGTKRKKNFRSKIIIYRWNKNNKQKIDEFEIAGQVNSPIFIYAGKYYTSVLDKNRKSSLIVIDKEKSNTAKQIKLPLGYKLEKIIPSPNRKSLFIALTGKNKTVFGMFENNLDEIVIINNYLPARAEIKNKIFKYVWGKYQNEIFIYGSQVYKFSLMNEKYKITLINEFPGCTRFSSKDFGDISSDGRKVVARGYSNGSIENIKLIYYKNWISFDNINYVGNAKLIGLGCR